MSLFNGIEKNDERRPGVLARLRGWRPGFTGDEPAALPLEPDFAPVRKLVNGPGAPMGSLGQRLRDADVTDVDARAADRSFVNECESTRQGTPEVDVADAVAFDGPVTTAFGRNPGAFTSNDDHASGPRATGAHGTRTHVTDGEIVGAASAALDEPDAVERNAEAAADPGAAQATSPFERGASEPPPVPPVAGAEVPPPNANALVESDVRYTPVGIPRLISAEALVDFKRVLSDTTPEATLRITGAARQEFVAVDVEAGVAIVIATAEFHQTALYATYVRDLERTHIVVREEMLAADDVIADVYERARLRVLRQAPEGSRAIALFRDVVEAAHAYGSSDIHFEQRDFENEVELRFRVNGDLYTYRRMPRDAVVRALSAAYQDLVQRNTNSGNAFQATAPQSAMIPLALPKDTLNLRWQSAAFVGGFDVALRLLDGNFRNYTVRMPNSMGLEASQLAIIDSLGHVSGGATFLSGETGSAKSTVLRALSYMVAGRELKKQYAVSLPSEYPMPWLSDLSIARSLDETDGEAQRKVAAVIRTFMRMDPDDLTVAEILDSVVAGLVAELALTGHPVRTTIHADSIIGVFMRLLGDRLKLTVDEVASEKFVNAVGNQKLIPLLCPHCKRPAEDVMPAAKLELLRMKFGLDTSKMACRDENGCGHCRLKGLLTRDGRVAGGTRGQTLAMELYRPAPEFLERVAARDWRGAENVWRRGRVTGFGDADMTGKTLYEHALYKASQGIIDPRFIDLSMRPFDVYRVMPDRDGRMPS
jgi:type II secretory ATPase GspE/PulE/Tfp pilus assembly ATPase PilB-like protein